MKRNSIVLLFSLVSLLNVSCQKMDQVFSNGEPVSETRELDKQFRVISMHNNVNVKLVQSRHPHIELTCPENLIGNITNEIVGDTLYVKNENQLNWLRSFDYTIDMTIYFDSLRAVNYASIGDLLCTDSIVGCLPADTSEPQVPNFWLNVMEGSGNIDLTINTGVMVNNFTNGTSNVTLRGRCNYTEQLLHSYGKVHAEELFSGYVTVQSLSTNDAYVWVKNGLKVGIYSIGNVYYRGNPTITQEITNDGKLIKME